MHFFSCKELGKCQGQKGTRECFSISHIEDEIKSIFSRAKLKAIKNNNNDNPQWVWHKRNLKSKLLWVHMCKHKLEMGDFKIFLKNIPRFVQQVQGLLLLLNSQSHFTNISFIHWSLLSLEYMSPTKFNWPTHTWVTSKLSG